MKTSELKGLANKNGFKVNLDDVGYLSITSNEKHPTDLLTIWKRYAVVSNEEPNSFSIYEPSELGNELVDAIIDYTRTPIDEREEQYLSVDIPLSDWKEITKGMDSKANTDNNSVTSTFKGDDGIDSFFKVIETIQGKYVEHVGYEATYDEIERKNTSH